MSWGEVNPTHAYYNGSCTSKDTEDPSWSTSLNTMRTEKTSSALEALWKTLFVLYLYLIGTLKVIPELVKGNFVPTAVLTKSGIVSVSASRPINTAALIRTDISQKDEKPIKKRQNRTRDGKVCGDEANQGQSPQMSNIRRQY
ncbi:hypothetical protein Tco_0745298 [Tanacetum coccineum]